MERKRGTSSIRLVIVALLAVVGSLAVAPGAQGAGGDLLWADQFDLAGGHDGAFGLAVQGGRGVAAGGAVNAAGDRDWLVQAYDAGTGALLWTDQFDLAGGSDLSWSIDAAGNRVFMGGDGTNSAGNLDWLVRAYDARTGALLWMDQFDTAGGGDLVSDLDAHGNRVFAVGGGGDCSQGWYIQDCDFVLRAYDARTGALLWADQFGPAAAFEVAAQGGRVFVAGSGTNAAGNADWLVRAYDARTGALLWTDQFDLGGTMDRAWPIDADGNRVFVGGSSFGLTGNRDWVVRAYDARTGALLWMDQFDLAGQWDEPLALAAAGPYVSVAGAGMNVGGKYGQHFDLLVRAYDARTGALLWMDQFDGAEGGDVAWDVEAGGDRVFVAGTGDCTSPYIYGNCDFLVRAYKAKTGALLWADQFDLAGDRDEAIAPVVRGDRVFVGGGGGQNAAGDFDWLIRAYDAR